MRALDLIDQPKEEVIPAVLKDNELADEFFELAISNKDRAWKAGWLLNNLYKKKEISKDYSCIRVCNSIEGKPSNQRRELLKLLEKCELNEENEGYIFDSAVYCWEQLDAQPSSRMVAFRIMLKVAKRHEELIPEIESLTQSRFLQALSPGIKRSIVKQLTAL